MPSHSKEETLKTQFYVRFHPAGAATTAKVVNPLDERNHATFKIDNNADSASIYEGTTVYTPESECDVVARAMTAPSTTKYCAKSIEFSGIQRSDNAIPFTYVNYYDQDNRSRHWKVWYDCKVDRKDDSDNS
jgi:hypothetical protein